MELKKYIGIESDRNPKKHPGPLDNRPLMKDDGKDLKDHLVKDLHYVLVPRDTWLEFVLIFGFQEETEPIKRKVIEYHNSLMVEVYLTELCIAKNSCMQHIRRIKFSKSDTLGKLYTTLFLSFSVYE